MTDSGQIRTENILSNIFEGYNGPVFAIQLWTGWEWRSKAGERPVCTLVVESPKALAALAAKPNEITLGDAFIQGDLDVEGDIFSVFAVVEHLLNRPRPMRQRVMETLARTLFVLGQQMRHGAVNSKRRDQASIAHHYDQPVDFFRPWLGESLVYSCAYFRTAGDSLERAQAQKLELICRKLRLKAGERFLDIGCGWGSLLLHAAGARGAQAEGVTLSREQAETTKRRIMESGLDGCCRAELRDYRELEDGLEPFDKIASVGMFEHVGLKNLPQYFGTAYRMLRPGGLFLNHGIARSAVAPVRQSSFIERFVFPDGRLVTLTEALQAAEAAGLEVRDVENLREHYEMTLRRWVKGLRRNADGLLQQVSRSTYRTWLLYMAGSAAAFRRGSIGVYQVLLSRPDRGKSGLPLTREDLYAAESYAEEVGV